MNTAHHRIRQIQIVEAGFGRVNVYFEVIDGPWCIVNGRALLVVLAARLGLFVVRLSAMVRQMGRLVGVFGWLIAFFTATLGVFIVFCAEIRGLFRPSALRCGLTARSLFSGRLFLTGYGLQKFL